ncbi:hypothetical protein OXX79_000402 [Metschnikowia pulcherrima]
MSLKLKLKVKPSKSPSVKTEPDVEAVEKPLPRIKIKHSASSKDNLGGISKPKPTKEKLKKLKLSLGKSGHVQPAAASTSEASAPVQPILKKVPKVRIKPTRVPGEGYDSEAPDVEDDPLIEQAIAVRFVNDANLDFLHSAADTGDFSNVNIKWITRDKAVINVNSTLYSARLIDLPTLTELYKTVDKKNIFKTIDVSQILLVLRTINPKNLNMEADFEVPEEYTYTHPLYKLSVNKEIRPSKTAYKHGLSNSFEDVYRRFRPKKVNHRLMTDIESRVDEIVRRDNEAQESHYDTNAEIEGEDDQMALDLEADLDIALEQELADALDSTSNNTAATVLMKSEYDNDDDENAVLGANDDDENDDDEDDEDDDEDDEDDEAKADKSRAKKLEEEITDLQNAAEKQKVLLATASHKMMRMKFQSAYNSLKAQFDSKKRELAKIREMLNKQPLGQMEASVRRNEEEEDDDDDEEADEDLVDDRTEATEPQQEPFTGTNDESQDADMKDAIDEDNYDDFQGLF